MGKIKGLFLILLTMLICSCAVLEEAEVDFPSLSDLEDAETLSDLKAEETSGSCDASNTQLIIKFPSGLKFIFDYGTIESGTSKKPEVTQEGDLQEGDIGNSTREESFDSVNCTGPIGTPII